MQGWGSREGNTLHPHWTGPPSYCTGRGEAMEEQLEAPAGARVTRGVGGRTLCTHLACAMNTDHRGSRSHESPRLWFEVPGVLPPGDNEWEVTHRVGFLGDHQGLHSPWKSSSGPLVQEHYGTLQP